jgi:hypothetical protein
MVVFLSDMEDIPENLEIQSYMFESPVRVNNYAQYVESEEEASDG